MNKEEIIVLLDDLLQDCYNDLYEYEEIEKQKADLIYNNVKLFTLKFKDKLEDIF